MASLDGIHEQNWKSSQKYQEETSIAVLQDHVTGKVFNTQPRNIAKKNHCSIWNRLVFVYDL